MQLNGPLVTATIAYTRGMPRPDTLYLNEPLGTGTLRVWADSGKQTEIELPEQWDLSTETPPSTIYIEGVDTSASVRDTVLRVQYQAGMINLEDTVSVTIINFNLAASDLFSANVPEDDEVSPGAYIHYNVDNDNENTNWLGAPVGDYTEEDAVDNEDDLQNCPATFAPTLTEGSVVLSRTDSAIRVWHADDKGTGQECLVGNSSKTWDFTSQPERTEFHTYKGQLYVEGVDEDNAQLLLTYKNSLGESVLVDTVSYTCIAATCGEQPWPVWYDDFATFPDLVGCEWSITADESQAYNCLAWSVGITNQWWNSIYTVPGPKDIDHEYGDGNGTMSDVELDRFYADTGSKRGGDDFLLLTGGDATPANADVMYYSGVHGARKQVDCTCGAGKWIMYGSKCGNGPRIEHVHDQLDGATYGSRVRYYGLAD